MIPAFAKGVLSMGRPDFIEMLKDPGLEIFSIPQGRDNFAYILREPGIDQVALVDAMEAKSIKILRASGLEPRANFEYSSPLRSCRCQ